jgi:hypothetical protein
MDALDQIGFKRMMMGVMGENYAYGKGKSLPEMSGRDQDSDGKAMPEMFL